MPTEAQVLAHVMDRTRQYTLSYFDRLKDQDLHRRFVCEGKELNTAFWLIAHLTTTENGLLLMATGGPFNKFSWAKHFNVGSTGLPPAECPPFAEVFEMLNAVHAKAIAHVATLSAEALEAPNVTGFASFGTTVRDVITHAIRHEGSHCGHLGWLCKLYGIKTV
ncbi:MAG: DinB family protein [Flavobacteriales bacterium]